MKYKVGDRVNVMIEADIVEIDHEYPDAPYLVELDDVIEVCGLVIRTCVGEDRMC